MNNNYNYSFPEAVFNEGMSQNRNDDGACFRSYGSYNFSPRVWMWLFCAFPWMAMFESFGKLGGYAFIALLIAEHVTIRKWWSLLFVGLLGGPIMVGIARWLAAHLPYFLKF